MTNFKISNFDSCSKKCLFQDFSNVGSTTTFHHWEKTVRKTHASNCLNLLVTLKEFLQPNLSGKQVKILGKNRFIFLR